LPWLKLMSTKFRLTLVGAKTPVAIYPCLEAFAAPSTNERRPLGQILSSPACLKPTLLATVSASWLATELASAHLTYSKILWFSRCQFTTFVGAICDLIMRLANKGLATMGTNESLVAPASQARAFNRTILSVGMLRVSECGSALLAYLFEAHNILRRYLSGFLNWGTQPGELRLSASDQLALALNHFTTLHSRMQRSIVPLLGLS